MPRLPSRLCLLLAGTLLSPTAYAAAPTAAVPPHQATATCLLSVPLETELPGLEWARQTSFRSVCRTAHWLDGLFGVEPYDPVAGVITGHLAFDIERREKENAEILPRLRVTVALPNVSRQLGLFFDRDRESKTIAGESAALHPESQVKGEESTSQFGVGYQFLRDLDASVDGRIGLRVREQRLDPFVRGVLKRRFADTGTDRWSFEQTLFWTHLESFGETSQLDYERHLGGPRMMRFSNAATLSERTDGFRWVSTLALFDALNDDRALQWAWGANGETGADERLTSHGPRISLRQRFPSRWLVTEAYVGLDFVKEAPGEDRTRRHYLGFKIEAYFNPP